MSATAVILNDFDAGRGPSWALGASGYSGRQPYLIDTDDPLQAFAAGGLPGRGAAHPTLAGSVVVGHTWEFLGIGSSVVYVDYAPPGGGFDFDTAEENDTYSEIISNEREQTTSLAADGSAVPETSIELSASELRVHVFAATMQPFLTWLPLFSPVPKINSNGFGVPNPFGIGGTITIQPRQCLARPVEVQRIRDGLCRVSFRMGIGQPGWMDTRFRPVDANGVATGPLQTKIMYEEAAFPAHLWGGA